MLYQISADLQPQAPDKTNITPNTGKILLQKTASIAKSAATVIVPTLAGQAAALKLQKLTGTEIYVIKTEEELAEYTHAFNADWTPMQLYLRHPFKEKLLIPQDSFKTYIAREMASEIIDYIGEHMALKEIAVSLINSKGGKGEVTVPIKKVVTNAELNCSVNQKYLLHSYNRKQTPSLRQYYWIQSFPDIISVVSGESSKSEIISECTSNFSFSADIKDIKAAFGKDKTLSFYIYYEKAD